MVAVTRVKVDKPLLGKAEQVYGVRTNREAIDLALRDSAAAAAAARGDRRPR